MKEPHILTASCKTLASFRDIPFLVSMVCEYQFSARYRGRQGICGQADGIDIVCVLRLLDNRIGLSGDSKIYMDYDIWLKVGVQHRTLDVSQGAASYLRILPLELRLPNHLASQVRRKE